MPRSVLLLLSGAGLALAADIYTVWSSIVYSNTGEIKPDELGAGLSNLGARQAYASGQFFRSQYLTASSHIRGLSVDSLVYDQLYVAAFDTRGAVGSAQAFMQGLYPPYSTSSNSSAQLDPTALSSTGEYVDAPLNGYQYPEIKVAATSDPEYVYLYGDYDCPAFLQAIDDLTSTTTWQTAKARSTADYDAAKRLFPNSTTATWDFDHAYTTYRTISFMDNHDAQAHTTLQNTRQPDTNRSYVDVFRDYASLQQQLRLTNMSALNRATGSNGLPDTTGSISTIAGNMLIGRVVDILSLSIKNRGSILKLATLFAGHDPMLSLFALFGINDGAYLGLPQRSSAMVFELYSWENSTNASYPTRDNLRVAFKFRNGTANGTPLSGPSKTDTTWDSFYTTAVTASLGGVANWCQQCGSACETWNINAQRTQDGTIVSSVSGGGSLTPVAAGAVGALVTLAVAILAFVLVLTLGRYRLQRQPHQAASALGGFKGSAKLASDPDLAMPKHGIVGLHGTNADDARREVPEVGHERTGSWEMRVKESKTSNFAPSIDYDPFADAYAEPVKPREHV